MDKSNSQKIPNDMKRREWLKTEKGRNNYKTGKL